MLIKNRYIFSTLILSSAVAVAADLNPSAGPADTSSYTLQDICNRLGSGEEGTQRNFTEPTSGPADSADCTLNEVMEKAPKKDTANGAQPADVPKGKTYWGLTDGNWGIKTGSSTAVDTKSGNATANEIKEGKIAWVDGKEVVGTLKLLIICNGTMHGKRWCDNEDGTVTDMTTGLVWLQNADWGGEYAFACSGGAVDCTTIFDRVSELKSGSSDANLYDDSDPYDWRIPTITELEKLNSDPEGVFSYKMRLFSGVQELYWSATVYADRTDGAWGMMLNGGSFPQDKTYTYYVWPVRSRLLDY